MSPRRDRMRGHKRDHGYHSRHENGPDRMPHPANEVWTEHISSSGKKYYYNSLCGISQWEKPNDWVEPPHRRPYAHGSRDNEADTSDHYPRRYRERDNSSHHHEANYRDHHHHHYHSHHHSSDYRGSRNSSHHNYSDSHHGHNVHENDNSSGSSTPVQEASRMRMNVHDSHVPHTMANTLPRNLSHQSSMPSMHHPTTTNSYQSSENANRHTSLNMLRNAKNDGMQTGGPYGNVTVSEAPMLTPSLAKYVSNDLTKHVQNWPADVLERQAHKFSEESYVLGNLQCLRVCTELKCARAIVRHMEIKATLQEQKMMYIRQQIEAINEIKPHNSILSDDA